MNDKDKSVYKEKKHAPKMPHRKYAYFRDDQIVLLVTKEEELSKKLEISEEQLQSIANKFTTLLREINPDSQQSLVPPEPKVDKLWSVAAGEDQQGALFMLAYKVEQAPEDPLYLAKVIGKFNEEVKTDSVFSGLKVVGASPNWLTSVAAQGGGTGGPGGKPSPYYGSRQNAPHCFDLVMKLEEEFKLLGKGDGVHVAILDTAPSAQALVSAYKEWPDHPLISTLLGPQGKLHLYPASYKELWQMSCTSLNDHDYKMTDHGLFIAGIVHSIAPEAEIHLIEVLNQYGVGDFTSFVEGLQKVYTEEIYRPGRKLVINCSWMLEFPRDELHCHHKNQMGDPDAEFERAILEFSESDQTLLPMLRSLFEEFYEKGRQAIAAAGNDGKREHQNRIRTRYPAALTKVTGVGALPNTLERNDIGKYRPSVFSNMSDLPEIEGIATLGGEEGEGNGVLGLYIGEFPDGSSNQSKWAWWAGTSFAAPVLTGAVAVVLSSSSIDRTDAAIAELYAKKIILNAGAGVKEDALPVKQS